MIHKIVFIGLVLFGCALRLSAQGCPNNLVQNGDFEIGNTAAIDEDIVQAPGWGPIWSNAVSNGGGNYSSGDLFGQGDVLAGSLVAPLPASQGQYAGFWCARQGFPVFREGIMNSLNASIAANSGVYQLSFKLACMSAISQQPVLSVMGTNGAIGTGTALVDHNTPPNFQLFPTVVELATTFIAGTCNNNFTTYTYTFDTSDPSFPALGIDHLFFTRAEGMSGGVFLALDDVCLTRLGDNLCTPCPDTLAWMEVDNHPNLGYTDLLLYNGDLVIAGQRTTIQGQLVDEVGRWDGSSWIDMSPSSFSADFEHLFLHQGRLWSTVAWTTGGLTYWDLAVWDDLSNDWTRQNIASSATIGGSVFEGALLTATSHVSGIVIAGQFDMIGSGSPSVAANNIVLWNDLSNTFTPLAGGLAGEVRALTVYNGEIIAGGGFASGGSGQVARWDGSSWQSLSGDLEVNPALNPGQRGVYSFGHWNGKLLVGGRFTAARNGASPVTGSRGLAVWDGSNWSALGGPAGGITSANNSHGVDGFKVYGDDIYLLGFFAQIGGLNTFGIARFNTILQTYNDIGSGLSLAAYDAECFPNAAGECELWISAEQLIGKFVCPPKTPPLTKTFDVTHQLETDTLLDLFDLAFRGFQDANDEYVAFGHSSVPNGSGGQDIELSVAKYDLTGRIIGTPQQHLNPNSDFWEMVEAAEVLDASGNQDGYLVLLYDDSNQRMFLQRLDNAGNLLWTDELAFQSSPAIPVRPRDFIIDGDLAVVVGEARQNNLVKPFLLTYDYRLRSAACARIYDVIATGASPVNSRALVVANRSCPGAQHYAIAGQIGNDMMYFEVEYNCVFGGVNLQVLSPVDGNPATSDRPVEILFDDRGGSCSPILVGLVDGSDDDRVFISDLQRKRHYTVAGRRLEVYGAIFNANHEVVIAGEYRDDTVERHGFLLAADHLEGLYGSGDGLLWSNAYFDDTYARSSLFDIDLAADDGYFAVGAGIQENPTSPPFAFDLEYHDSWVLKTDPDGKLANCDCFVPLRWDADFYGGNAGMEVRLETSYAIANPSFALTSNDLLAAEHICDRYCPDECCVDINEFEGAVQGDFVLTLSGATLTLDNSLLRDCVELTVDWGDGQVENITAADLPYSHTYGPVSGTFVLSIIAIQRDPDGLICGEAEYTNTVVSTEQPPAPLELNCFPNPASTSMEVRWPAEIALDRLVVYTLTGQQVGVHTLTGLAGRYRLDVADLPEGVYLLQIRAADGRLTNRKLVKQ